MVIPIHNLIAPMARWGVETGELPEAHRPFSLVYTMQWQTRDSVSNKVEGEDLCCLILCHLDIAEKMPPPDWPVVYLMVVVEGPAHCVLPPLGWWSCLL